MKRHVITIENNGRMDPEDLIRRLVTSAFERVDSSKKKASSLSGAVSSTYSPLILTMLSG